MLVCLVFGCSNKQQNNWQPSEAYRIMEIALEATARDTDRNNPRPTVTSRALAMVCMSMFDAWSVYDPKAVGLEIDPSLRRPEKERTLENKNKAIGHAALATLLNVFPDDSAYIIEKMEKRGYSIKNQPSEPNSPVAIGNLAATNIIEACRNDGSNQYQKYTDYTGYQPVNEPQAIKDPNRWQQVPFVNLSTSEKYYPGCLTPHWAKVRPFALDSASMFRPGPPPLVGDAQLEKEVLEVMEMNATLTPEQKALVEFMRDGPHSVQQAGHWLIFSMSVSRRDKNDTDRDVKMFLAVSAAAMDAFIAAWDAKMAYDSSRPYTLVRYLFGDKKIRGWGGPHMGTVELLGKDWKPYSPVSFCTPSFPSYVSGHSTVSGACSEILKLYTGSDYFGEQEVRKPGALTEPELEADSVVLKFETFSQTAEMAGISRVLGGYHIQADNIEGLILGRKVGAYVWEKVKRHIEGTVAKNQVSKK